MIRKLLASALLAAALPAPAQDLKSFEANTTVHVLKNGWSFLLVERPEAPVFSFFTLADVGSAQEVPGITGLAHMFEHMAFKGTPWIGSKNWPEEKKALDEVEQVYARLEEERRLMYVGITRARATLVVSVLKRRKRGREMVAGIASRFIAEMKLNEATAVLDPRAKLQALRAAAVERARRAASAGSLAAEDAA